MKQHVLLTICLALLCTPPIEAATPIHFKIIAFGGSVSIRSQNGQPIKVEKDATVPTGSQISTANNSWIDLSQGGLSVLRVKSGTESLTIEESSLEKTTGQSSTVFKLKNGSVFTRVNKNALKKGSKYQIQMPELIAGVFGSQCETGCGAIGSSIYNVKGNIGGEIVNQKGMIIGKIRTLAEGEVMFHSNQADEKAGFERYPTEVKNRLASTSSTLPEPTGDPLEGTPKGGSTETSVVNALIMMVEATTPVATPGLSPNTPEALQVPLEPLPESSSLPQDISKAGLLPPKPTESSPTAP